MHGVLAESGSQHVAGEIGYAVMAIVALAMLAAFVGKVFTTIFQEWRTSLVIFLVVGVVATFVAAILVPVFVTALLIGLGFAVAAVIITAFFG